MLVGATRTTGSVVSVARASRELPSAARRNHVHLHRTKRSVSLRVRRIVRQRVLVSNIVRDVLANLFHIANIFRKKRQPARSLGDIFQRSLRALRVLLVLFPE